MRFSCLVLTCAIGIAGFWPPSSALAQHAPASGNVPAGETFSLVLAAAPAGTAPATGTLQFIGTATVLLRYRGLTILTDPNFLPKGEGIHLGYGLHSQRLTNPALELAQLPPIDLVILSHLHEDHFDKLVQQKLPRDTPIVSTRETTERLERLGFRRRFPLSRWDTLEVVKGVDRLRVTAMPARHGSALVSVLLPTVMGSMLEFSSGGDTPYRMYVSGDTLVFDDIADIARRYPNIDLALLHLGGTRLLGALKVSMDGEDGVAMMQLVAPQRAIPIHYSDYDAYKSPLGDFELAVKDAGLESKVTYLKHGETYQFMPAHR